MIVASGISHSASDSGANRRLILSAAYLAFLLLILVSHAAAVSRRSSSTFHASCAGMTAVITYPHEHVYGQYNSEEDVWTFLALHDCLSAEQRSALSEAILTALPEPCYDRPLISSTRRPSWKMRRRAESRPSSCWGRTIGFTGA